ncbi:pectinesterase-like [Cryptomeria japonica]|uniref:pectinesterase-like n=1 Tax=Cryptomeria japonica TaxID=3369 RepID=UPI0025AB7587|nr:pectinesterase-like [Cryptomeria japonica]
MKSFARVGEAIDERKAENSKSRGILVALTSILLLAAHMFVAVEASVGSNANDNPHHQSWKTVSKVANSLCSKTRYPQRCVSSMASYPAYQTAKLGDLTNVALQVSVQRAQKARDFALSIQNNVMNERERAAWKDCLELFEDTIERLNVCSSNGFLEKDSPVWLSAALTNQETCLNGFSDLNLSASNPIQAFMSSRAVNLSELVSNSLSMYKLSTMPTITGNNRRLLSFKNNEEADFYSSYGRLNEDGFPEWLSVGDRKLLQSSSPASQANVVVAQDGSGNYRTIAQAISAVPQGSSKRYIIYIKAGTYKENIDISNKITNLMLVGDGMDKTIVTGSKSVQDGVTTFQTATVAVSGNGFIARDMTFENTAGAAKQQAVALRVGSDLSAVYRCSIKGYQDTLYVYSLRQFYSEVDIYGTVDFIFGNAAVVIQNSNIIARLPMSNQQNTLTAQGRSDPNENTGISIHKCVVSASSDLQAVKGSIKTYLGRPWKEYSRTVFMQSTLGDLIDPAGWLPWSGNFALSTLYYGEYMNSGAGAGTSKRVNWPGYHVMTSATEASKFTVANFISGTSWIPATGATYTSGLN